MARLRHFGIVVRVAGRMCCVVVLTINTVVDSLRLLNPKVRAG